MSEWAPKRFYETATVSEETEGFVVHLDERSIRTPGKNPIVMPSADMAEAVAAEWMAQEDRIDPTTMPWTRSVNSAIDKVTVQRDEVAAHLASYAESDLLCYRADGPEGLIQRQQAIWDPLLDWAGERCGTRLQVTTGVMPVAQPRQAIEALAGCMEPMSEFHLTGFHDLVTLSGSFILAFAAISEFQPAEKLWEASRVDEAWQIEQWGDDEEASESAEVKYRAFLHASKFFRSA